MIEITMKTMIPITIHTLIKIAIHTMIQTIIHTLIQMTNQPYLAATPSSPLCCAANASSWEIFSFVSNNVFLPRALQSQCSCLSSLLLQSC